MKNTFLLLLACYFLFACGSKEETFVNFTYPQGKYKSLIMSYDDGIVEDIQLTKLFNQHRIVGTFNLNSEYLGLTRGWAQENGDTVFQTYIPKDSLLYIYKNHEIAAHGAFHKNFPSISGKEVLDEVNMDIAELSRLTNREIKSLAYPFGNTNDSVAKLIATTQITNARTIADTYKFELPTNYLIWNPTCHDTKALDCLNPYLVLDKHEMSLFYVWGHSWELRDKNRWENMVKFCEQIGNRDDIWYVSCGEFIDYLKTIKELEINENEIINPAWNDTVWMELSSGFRVLKPGNKLKLKTTINQH